MVVVGQTSSSVSRWFAPTATAENSWLLALATAALLARGVTNPSRSNRDGRALPGRNTDGARGSVAPFTGDDRQRTEALTHTRANALGVTN